jgi:hypothetical protein
MKTRALHGLFVCFLASPLIASEGESSLRPRPDLGPAFQTWQAHAGPSWKLATDGETGFAQMLYGGNLATRFQPRDDAEFVPLALQHLAQTQQLHGIEPSTLQLVRTLHLPLGMIGSNDKLTVRFRQVVNGVPVEDGYVNVLFDMQGRLLSIQTTGMPNVAQVPTSPAIDAERARAIAASAFTRETGLEPDVIQAAELIVDQYFDGEERLPRLAWKVNVQALGTDAPATGFHQFVDAALGLVYRHTASVHNFDVSGTVRSNATPGVLPDTGANPETQQLMRFMRVQAGAQTAFTDTNGNFTLTGVNAPVSATFTYVGTHNNVTNQAGVPYALTTTLNQATGNNVLLNPSSTAEITAQANAFRCVNLMRDFIKSINPSDTSADGVFTANTNLNQTCNAFYDGGSINFFIAGSCVNTAYSTVIAHEHGHWMNDIYLTGNGPDGMGEGNADVWGMYIFDTPIIGQNFQGTSHIRTGLNTMAFCGDSNPGCYGQVHADGEPWMGAAWKIRNRLNTTNGNAAGDLAANSIFVSWMNAYNQQTIRSIIEIQWLTLDDNDGNIDTGTPHFNDIDLGFRDQGFPGYTVQPFAFTNVTTLPDTLDQIGPYAVSATVSGNQGPATSVQLFYRVEGAAFVSVPMTNTGGNVWSGQIPGIASPAHVEYYLQATNASATTGRFPKTAPNLLLDFDIGTVTVLRTFNFDGPVDDQGWTHGTIGDTSNPNDDWQRETPAGQAGATWQDPNASVSPTICWGTDLGNGNFNGAYQANVHSFLRMPVTNCTGATDVRLRFKRWLSVQGSASDQARILVNGQQIYINPTTTLNDGQWVTQELFLGAIANNNPAVTVEWRLRSNGTNHFGGWAIDDVELLWIAQASQPCPQPQNYCVTSPNSVGPGAVMSWSGSQSIVTNNFALIATGCPMGTPGLFFYGQAAAQTAFGNGFRCIGGQLFRLPVTNADIFGNAQHALNFQGPLPAPISAGQNWRFQFWYRNPAGGGAGFNLSDGLHVPFCP